MAALLCAPHPASTSGALASLRCCKCQHLSPVDIYTGCQKCVCRDCMNQHQALKKIISDSRACGYRHKEATNEGALKSDNMQWALEVLKALTKLKALMAAKHEPKHHGRLRCVGPPGNGGEVWEAWLGSSINRPITYVTKQQGSLRRVGAHGDGGEV